jgi:hypothetical protein
VQDRQCFCRFLVVHHRGLRDDLDVGRMHDGDGVDMRDQPVVYLPGVGRHFDHDGVQLGEVLSDPGFELVPGHAGRAADHAQFAVHGGGDHIVAVDVQPEEALDVAEVAPALGDLGQVGFPESQ